MSTTAQQCFDRAVIRSSLNNEDLFPIDDALAYLSSYEQQLYAIVGQANPDYFGVEVETAARTAYLDYWDLNSDPGNVGIITAIKCTTLVGTPPGLLLNRDCNIVNLRYPDFALAPRVYLRDNKVYGYLTDLGSADTDMVTKVTIYYSPIPTQLATASQTVTIPDTWISLLITPLAAIMALADQRPDDYKILMEEYNREYQSFLGFVVAHAASTYQPMGIAPQGV